jgi:hypothetical protein
MEITAEGVLKLIRGAELGRRNWRSAEANMSQVMKRVATIGVAVMVLVAALLFARPRTIDAQCLAQPEDGSWTNTDPATRSLTRVVLRFTCQDQVLNGQLYPPGPPWHVHLWGKCYPTDCDWGETGATRLSTGHIYGTYDQGFAKRYVYARMSQYRPGQLWVYVWTDFTDPNRQDYGVHNWFRK